MLNTDATCIKAEFLFVEGRVRRYIHPIKTNQNTENEKCFKKKEEQQEEEGKWSRARQQKTYWAQ